MKKNILIFSTAICVIAGCFAGKVIAQSKSVTFSIPASGASSKAVTSTSAPVTFDRIVTNLYPESNIDGVNITSVNIESGKDLTMFKSIKIYLCRIDGSNPVLLGSRPNVPKNAGNSLFIDGGKKSGGDSNSIVASQIEPNTRLEDLIARLPGVMPGGGGFTIRGKSTTGSGNVLFVLDNIQTGGMPMVNTSTIQSIKVLKDPTELSPYGMMGANGVILITSKVGKLDSQVKGSPDDSTVRVRIEYVLRDALTSEAGLNVILASSNKQ